MRRGRLSGPRARPARRGCPLVDFDAAFYVYPNSFSRGFRGKYLLEAGLDDAQRRRRDEWLRETEALAATPFGLLVSGTFGHKGDAGLLASLLGRHGVFAERFFAHRVRERVSRRLAGSMVDLEELRGLSPAGWGYAVHGGGTVSDVIRSILDQLYAQTVTAALSDSSVRSALEAWFEKASAPRECVLCDDELRLIDLPDWAYFGSGGYKACCLRCSILARPDRRRVADLVPAFVAACGFIPSGECGPVSHAFTSRLTAKQWPDAVRLWAAMGGAENVRKKFGSWFTALAKTGALPDGVMVTQKGVRCLSDDGHVCHSLDERRIDNWLTGNRIPHEREPRYPYHRTLNPTATRRADWRVGDTFIEYCGLFGDPDYDRKMDEKVLLAQHANINILMLYPDDLHSLGDRLTRFVAA